MKKTNKKLNWQTSKTIYPSDILKKIVVVKKGTRKQRDRALKKTLGRDINPQKIRVLAEDEEYVEVKAPEKKHWKEGERIKDTWKKQYRPKRKRFSLSQSEKRIQCKKRNALKVAENHHLTEIKLANDISEEKKISKILDSELQNYESFSSATRSNYLKNNPFKHKMLSLRVPPRSRSQIKSQKISIKPKKSDWIYKDKIVIRHPSILRSIKKMYSNKPFCPLEKKQVTNNELFDKAMEARKLLAKRKNLTNLSKNKAGSAKRNRIKSFMNIVDQEPNSSSFAKKVSEYLNRLKTQKPTKKVFRKGSFVQDLEIDPALLKTEDHYLNYNANETYSRRMTADIQQKTGSLISTVSDIKSKIRARIIDVAKKREKSTKIEKKQQLQKMLKVLKEDDLFAFRMLWLQYDSMHTYLNHV